jgi:DNA-binding Lrp family transcriptional regulator
MPGELPKVAELAQRISQVVECHRTTGEDCFIMKVYFRAIDELDEVLDQFLAHGHPHARELRKKDRAATSPLNGYLSRARHEIQIFTDDLDRLPDRIAQPLAQESALEAARNMRSRS